MSGLLLKDLLNLKHQGRIYLLIIAVYAVLAFFQQDASFLVWITVFLSMMSVVNAMAYDENARWDRYALTMPSKVDDDFLEKIFGIDPADTVQYAGRLSMSAASADSVMAVQPVPGKEDQVREALEERLEFVRESFRQFQPESYEKAQAGTVCQEGDSLFLLILGREGEDPAQEIQAAQSDLRDWLGN